MSQPEPQQLSRVALFLDFDGTLIEFAETPMAVQVPAELRTLLTDLHVATDGALAIVSGRSVDVLDALLALPFLHLAGLHGLQRRAPGQPVKLTVRTDDGRLFGIRASLQAFVDAHPLCVLEDKRVSLALHVRRAPEMAGEAQALCSALIAPHTGELELQSGVDVVEIRPTGADKGSVVGDLMTIHPFCGRRPIFIGDDQTDEHGFRAVNRLDGLSVKIGKGQTDAVCRLPSPEDLLRWLRRTLSVGEQ